MAGLYSILHTWISNETLSAADLDAEILNVKNNFIATMMEGYSSVNNVANLTRIQSETDPAPSGNPLSSAGNSSVAGEIQKLRYQIRKILGSTNWYDAPTSSLGFSISSVVFYNDCDTLQRFIAQGGEFASRTPQEQSTSKFGTGSILLQDAASPSSYCNSFMKTKRMNTKKFTLSFWVNGPSVSKGIVSHYPLGLSLRTNASGYPVLTVYCQNATSGTAKQSYTITGTTPICDGAWHNIIIAIDASGADGSHSMTLYADGVSQGTPIGSGTIRLPARVGSGFAFNSWVDFPQNNNTFDTQAAMFSNPPTGFTQTASGSNGTIAATFANGALTLVSTGSDKTLCFDNASFAGTIGVLGNLIVSFGLRIDQDAPTGATSMTYTSKPVQFNVRDGALSFEMYFSPSEIYMTEGAAGTNTVRAKVDMSRFHAFDVVFSLGVATVYMDGFAIGSLTLSTANLGAARIRLGHAPSTNTHTTTSVWTYMNIGQTPTVGPSSSSLNVQPFSIDDLLCVNDVKTVASGFYSFIQSSPGSSLISVAPSILDPVVAPFWNYNSVPTKTGSAGGLLVFPGDPSSLASGYSCPTIMSDGERKIILTATGTFGLDTSGDDIYMGLMAVPINNNPSTYPLPSVSYMRALGLPMQRATNPGASKKIPISIATSIYLPAGAWKIYVLGGLVTGADVLSLYCEDLLVDAHYA